MQRLVVGHHPNVMATPVPVLFLELAAYQRFQSGAPATFLRQHPIASAELATAGRGLGSISTASESMRPTGAPSVEETPDRPDAPQSLPCAGYCRRSTRHDLCRGRTLSIWLAQNRRRDAAFEIAVRLGLDEPGYRVEVRAPPGGPRSREIGLTRCSSVGSARLGRQRAGSCTARLAAETPHRAAHWELPPNR
jgi:hypothetical protein